MVATLQIDAVVLHSIKRSVRGEDVEPELSQAEPTLEPATKAFLQEQIRKAMKYGRDVIEEEGLSKLPDEVRSYLVGNTSLLACSQELARMLQASQPSQSPEGLLMVADARLDGSRTFIVAKLEHERGAQAHQTNQRGKLVFGMKFLDDLFFTTGSRVYKIGCFEVETMAAPDAPLHGIVVDRQVQAHHVAKYFRENYLGCVWREKPDLVTERFFNAAQAWINEHVTDQEKRARYQVALLSDLQSPSAGISVNGFAERYLDNSDRDGFIATMRDSSVPLRDMPKSIDFVRSRLANVRIDTATGVIVMAPPERMQDGTVTVEDQGDGSALVQVHDRVSTTSGYGTYRAVDSAHNQPDSDG